MADLGGVADGGTLAPESFSLVPCAFAAGPAVGMWVDDTAVASTWRPGTRIEPGHSLDRDRWRDAVARAEHWLPDLSAIDF